MRSAGSFRRLTPSPLEVPVNETTDPIPPDGPVGLPSRIVGRLRRDVPLALIDVAVVVPAYLVPLVLRFHGSVPSESWSSFWCSSP